MTSSTRETDANSSPKKAFQPKPSKATQWWLGILAVVLAILFWETKGQPHSGFNFFINTDSDAEGAEVLVDGQKQGKIGDSTSTGIGGGAFWGHLSRGKHTVELRKNGYAPCSKEIDMHGEEYLGVDLQRNKN